MVCSHGVSTTAPKLRFDGEPRAQCWVTGIELVKMQRKAQMTASFLLDAMPFAPSSDLATEIEPIKSEGLPYPSSVALVPSSFQPPPPARARARAKRS